MPDQKLARLQADYGISTYEAGILLEDLELAHYFETAANFTKEKQLINWVLRDLMGYLKESKQTLATCKVTPEKLAELINLIGNGTINTRVGQEIFEEIAETGNTPTAVVKEKGLEQIGDLSELETIIQEIILANPTVVADYKSGKDRLFGFFVGQAMQKTKGKGNPKIINDLLKKHLG